MTQQGHEAAATAIAAIEKMLRDLLHETAVSDVYTQTAARVIALYEHPLDGGTSTGGEAWQLRKAGLLAPMRIWPGAPTNH